VLENQHVVSYRRGDLYDRATADFIALPKRKGWRSENIDLGYRSALHRVTPVFDNPHSHTICHDPSSP
jgi:hypothetical protein